MSSVKTSGEPAVHADFADLLGFIHANEDAFARTPGFANFYETLEGEEARRLAQLWAIVGALEDGRHDDAEVQSELLVRNLPDEEDGNGSLAVRCFAEALLGRARKLEAGGGNLYLNGRPPGAQLRAFDLLRLRTPLIPFGYAAGNRALIECIPSPTDVTIVDVGIGRGGQLRAMLRNPSGRRMFQSLHVIGVEPDSSSRTCAGALEVAQQNLQQTADEVGFKLSFSAIPKTAETLTAEDIRNAGPRGLLVGVSTLALHHVPEGNGGRDAVLRTLREAGLKALVLVEADSNHFVDALRVRFLNAFRHYFTVARSLHSMLSASDAWLVFVEFFANEVRNVVIHEGTRRTERHEEARTWVERLQGAGWKVDTLQDVVPESAAPAGFEVASRQSAFSLLYRGAPLLSVIRARA